MKCFGTSTISSDVNTIRFNFPYQPIRAYDLELLDAKHCRSNAQSNLYNIQRVTVTEQYNYLLQTLLLKKTAGTLSPQDIFTLNRLMRKRTEIITEKDIIHTEIPKHNIPTQLDIHASQYEAEKIIPFSATTKHHSKKTTKKKKKSHQ